MKRALRRRGAPQHLPPGFRFHFVPRCTGFFRGQQLQLQIAQRFALRTQLLNPLLAQLLFERLDFQLCPVQLPLQFSGARGSVRSEESEYEGQQQTEGDDATVSGARRLRLLFGHRAHSAMPSFTEPRCSRCRLGERDYHLENSRRLNP